MARIRTIKPEFAYDEELATLPMQTRLFFILLWTHCDKAGRCEDRPAKLRALIFPYEPDVDCENLLRQLAPKFVLRYETDGRRYLQVQAWARHQRPHPTEPESNIAAPVNKQTISVAAGFKTGEAGLQTLWKGNGNDTGEGKGNELASIAKAPEAYAPAEPKAIKAVEALAKCSVVRLPKAAIISAWLRAFPDIDIAAELLKADAWAQARAITRSPKGWARTMQTWLGKEQDRAKPGAQAQGGVPGRVVGHAKPIAGKYDHLG